MFSQSYGETLLRFRWLVLLLLAAFTVACSAGVKNLFFDNDYRAFFGETNPQLEAFERLQKTYTKIDNVQFAFEPSVSKNVISKNILMAVEALTERAWLLPYSLRVDSISNYQHTTVFEDDLIVDDLYSNFELLDAQEVDLVASISQSKPSLTVVDFSKKALKKTR